MNLDTHLFKMTTAHDLPCGGCDPDDACEECQEYYDDLCERCGGETSTQRVGDETYTICSDCGAFDGS